HCYLCLNGGEDLYCCMQCPQVICNQCILVLAESHSQVREADMDFTCPVFYEATDRENSGQTGRSFSPYWGFTFHALKKPVLMTFPIMSSCIVTTAGSQVNCELLLIIHFYCKGMDFQGSPPQAIMTTFGCIPDPGTCNYCSWSLNLPPVPRSICTEKKNVIVVRGNLPSSTELHGDFHQHA
ncbi:hypothetical protein PAXRUDRAFT_165487, partial [Paxillus rubicundulus Ve08.2h10]